MAEDKKKYKPAQLGAAHLNASAYKESRHFEMVQKRERHLGGSILFYHEPAHLVSGQGVWLIDDKGQKYLDCYNNVASVGHCHPQVVKTLSEEAGKLNTHTRYLHPNVINYAEKLASLMPDELEVCFFTCTGSEAIDLAIRLARNYTKNQGVVVMENSYHGNTTLVDELSTIAHPSASHRAAHVVAVEPPNTYRGPYRAGEHDKLGQKYADLVSDAADELISKGQGVAAFLCDTIFDTQGTLEAPKDYFQKVYQDIRAKGGLCIADEVQAGLCRTGNWWGFEEYGVVPDIVVLGKPLGDGHPLAAVVVRKKIVEAFTADNKFYFNTFAGNPVSSAVGHKVLEICEQQSLGKNCQDIGAYLKSVLNKLSTKHTIIGDVRGHGLFLGVELVHDRRTKAPAADIARLIPDAMKTKGVLVGMTGRYGNVLKVRPPLVFTKKDADFLLKALDQVLSELNGISVGVPDSVPGEVSQALSQSPIQAPTQDTATRPKLSNKKVLKVLTERVLKALICSGVKQVCVAKVAVITPLAKELAKANDIEIIRE